MSTYIIKSNCGFLVTLNSQVARWSDEYPDAVVFYTLGLAKKALRTIPLTVTLCDARIIENYGLDAEREA